MKKTFLLPLLLVLFAGSLSAAPVTEAVAHQVAKNFWNTYRPETQKPVEQLQSLTFPELHNMYVFANDDLGFVIVSADDCVLPILGYSFDSPFPTERLNPELRFWLRGYEEQIEAAREMGRATDSRWGSLLSNPVPETPLSLLNVPMLCNTAWDQDDPYNELCPYDDHYHTRAVVGCVATAMAQIMKRWNHPSCGSGSHFYSHYNNDLPYSYGMLSADFENTTYIWEDMPVRLTSGSTTEARNAVSTLSYHCGVAVDMQYGPSATGGSSAYSYCGGQVNACAVTAFPRYFKYEPTLYHRTRANFNDSAWLSMIDADLEQGRPIYYSGRDDDGGHAFVLDGSDLDTHYHFNWGWSGYGNGYYSMSNLALGSGGSGGNATYTFNQSQGAIFGIVPIPESFDTVEVWDTVCNNRNQYIFYDYGLPVADCDTFLRHLDTIFLLHLHRVSTYMLTFRPNYGQGSEFNSNYCYVDSVVMPECPFTKDGYRFKGWCQSKRGNDIIYRAGETVKLFGHLIFYAIWQDTNVGIDMVEEESMVLWPNPTTGELNVVIPEQEGQIVVVDAVGRTVLREEYPNVMGGSAKISLSALPDGIYTVRVKTSRGVYNHRIIKQ